MAHFAKLDSNNVVLGVNTVNNDVFETEEQGIEFLKSLHGSDTVWKQTSYNTKEGVHALGGTPFRKNYAAIGSTYDSERDAFIPPKQFNSWVLNETKCVWVAPVSDPTTLTYTDSNGDEQNYLIFWDEDNTRWNARDKEDNYFYWDSSNLSWTSYTP